jgi:hypothetical protein
LSNLNQHCEPHAENNVSQQPLKKEKKHGGNKERRFEAGLCGDGSRQTAGNR